MIIVTKGLYLFRTFSMILAQTFRVSLTCNKCMLSIILFVTYIYMKAAHHEVGSRLMVDVASAAVALSSVTSDQVSEHMR